MESGGGGMNRKSLDGEVILEKFYVRVIRGSIITSEVVYAKDKADAVTEYYNRPRQTTSAII
jgi:hypothetical protein